MNDILQYPKTLDDVLASLFWCAEDHITREYRSITLGEHQVRLLLDFLHKATVAHVVTGANKAPAE